MNLVSMPKDQKTKTELNVPAPPRTRLNRGLPEAPKANEVQSTNLSTSNTGLQDMNFKMNADFHRAFKMTAAGRNMAMKEMLEASFRCWVDLNGTEQEKSWLPSTIDK